MEHVTSLHDDTMVVIKEIGDYDVKKILVDSGFRQNILFLNAFLALRKFKGDLKKLDSFWSNLREVSLTH